MKSTSFFKLTAVAAAFSLYAGAASALTPPPSLSFTQVSPTTWTSTFSNSVGYNSTFSDLFTFTDPVTPARIGDNGSGTLNLNPVGSIFVTLFQLIDTTTNAILGTGYTGGTCTQGMCLNFGLPSTSDTYGVVVQGYTSGTNGGSYSGQISVSAVPEPKTYAMLLAGLGLLAFTARRRKSNSFFAY